MVKGNLVINEARLKRVLIGVAHLLVIVTLMAVLAGVAQAAAPMPEPKPKKVSPILECVVDHGDGTYTAYFGYENPNTFEVTIPIGSDNTFTPDPQDRGQPTTFQPGRTPYICPLS